LRLGCYIIALCWFIFQIISSHVCDLALRSTTCKVKRYKRYTTKGKGLRSPSLSLAAPVVVGHENIDGYVSQPMWRDFPRDILRESAHGGGLDSEDECKEENLHFQELRRLVTHPIQNRSSLPPEEDVGGCSPCSTSAPSR
jgi:hypothetical protein